jgi:hypothetical protein
MASRTPNNATAKLTATTRRRLCLAESTDNGKPQVCIRDLDHTGGHTPAPRDQIPKPVRERLTDGDTSDLPLEGPGAVGFDGVHYPPPDPTPHGPSDALAAKFFPDPPVTADELVAAEPEQAADAGALAGPDQPRPVAVSGAPGSRLADVARRAVHLTLDAYPADVHDEVIWTEIATHALVSMREEQARTKRGADPALITAARDAVLHVAQVRGLA